MQTFDIRNPLPSGTTLLEASAGTGKTWAIAAIVTRSVAEGELRLGQMLVVTFTRAASQELRQRVREQIAEAAAVLTDHTKAHESNALHEWLLDCDEPDRTERLRRLTDALSEFDAATIATIHQFCQIVLRSLGVAGDTDQEAVLVDDLTELVDEVADDLYLRDHAVVEKPYLSHVEARSVARAVMRDPRARIEPHAALKESDDPRLLARVRFTREVRDVVAHRKRRAGLLNHDDLLSELADALSRGTSASERMRSRWSLVLIDEFQDTDPVQWHVFDRAFRGHTTMVLIGDPKQAIYGFRGGDVTTYLQARSVVDHQQTLDTNFRSDPGLVNGVNALLAPAALGDAAIDVRPIHARLEESRLSSTTHSIAPIRMRLARKEEIGAPPSSKPVIAQWRKHVIKDLAADIRSLLVSDTTFKGRPLRAGDVAVLAARRDTLHQAQQALREIGIASVIGSGGSVFHTEAATAWITLLQALEQPHRADRVRAAALTPFFGVTAVELDADLPVEGREGADLTDQLSEQMRTLAALLTSHGVAAVTEHCVLNGLNQRVLARVGGERTLTDLRHVGELLHRAALEHRFSVVGLLSWLRDQVLDERTDVSGERTKRLESDADAVQLVTVHGSKGLQYPVVYLPSLWDRWVGKPGDVILHHDEHGVRCLDIGGPSKWSREAAARQYVEEAGESLRLLYVALTRAQSQVVAWYVPSNSNTPESALHRVLMGRRPGDAHVPDRQDLRPDDDLMRIFGAWRDAGAFTPELAVPGQLTPLQQTPERPDLSARSFDRTVDTGWRRTSYSALSAAASTAHGASTPELSEPEVELEVGDTLNPTLATEPSGHEESPLAQVPSPMADLPMGATFGSLVHAVLEHADPAAEDVRADLLDLIHTHLVEWPVPLDPDLLADALVQVVTTPMGPLTGQRTLLDVATTDRLCELDFEVPLSGGDESHLRKVGVGTVEDPTTLDDVRLGDLVPLLEAHLPPGDAVRSYADQLIADPALASQSLRGYLTGSIDLVMRVQDGTTARFLTVDYKTNWLGPYDAPLTAESYRPEALNEAMAHSDYPLQALLYTVVLHRYLRWRLVGYDPQTHLGGVLYLYLRGMCGPETPIVDGEPCGVFSWRAPVALVHDLSDLLDGRTPVHASTGGTR